MAELPKPPTCGECGAELWKAAGPGDGAFCPNGHGRIKGGIKMWAKSKKERIAWAESLKVAYAPNEGERKTVKKRRLYYVGDERIPVRIVRAVGRGDMLSPGNIVARFDSPRVMVRECEPIGI